MAMLVPSAAPRLTNNRVAPEPLRLGRQSPTGNALAELGAGVAAVGVQVEETYAKRYEAVTQARLLETDRKLADWEREAIDNGALQRRGKDAAVVPDKALQDFDRKAEEVTRELNDDQRRRMQSEINRRRESLGKKLGEHARREVQRYELESTQGSVDSARDAAAQNFADPARRAQEIERGESAIRNYGQLHGEAPELTEEKLKHFRSQAHLSILGRMREAGDAAGAQQYFNEHQGSMSEQARVEAERFTKGAAVESEANRIMEQYRRDVRRGDAALQALEKQEGLDPEVADAIRRRVRESVSLMRSEREGQYQQSATALTRKIAEGRADPSDINAVEQLYRRGAITPSEYSSLAGQLYRGAAERAERAAAAEEFARGIEQGLPVDPKNPKHREMLAEQFTHDAQGAPVGSARWQGLALAWAGRTRMLPEPAAAWLRQGLRSPDPKLAAAAAQFYGALQQQAPEGVPDLDAESRAFAGVMSSMMEAGTDAQRAFETARSSVYEADSATKERRKSEYERMAKRVDGTLETLIDRDFDTVTTRQPEASESLRADFDRQMRQYYLATGDANLARDLAWKDLTRVYGTTRVNGEPVVSAFPPERFGVSAEEVRADIARSLAAAQGGEANVKPEDVLVIADGLTLRAVTDALTGNPVAPSYRLITKDGDLVLSADGTPLRYTLPDAQELTRRTQEAREKARAQAQAAVQRARERHQALQRSLDAPYLAMPHP